MENAVAVKDRVEQELAAYLLNVRKDLAWASSELAYIAHTMVGERSETTCDLLLSICLALNEDKDGLAKYTQALQARLIAEPGTRPSPTGQR